MGLKITAKCLPRYFDRLKAFGVDYRQFDEITFVNSVTGKEKTFYVDLVRQMDDSEREIIKDLTPEVSWDEEKPIYAIDLMKQKKQGAKKAKKK